MKFIDEKPETPVTKTCEKHGAYEVKYNPWLIGNKFMVFEECPDCVDEEAKATQAEEKQKEIEIAKSRAGLGARHWLCSFDSFIADSEAKAAALRKVKAYTEFIKTGKGACLIMAGKVGTGKTHLAAAIVNELIPENKRCELVKMTVLIRSLKDTWGRASQYTEGQLIDRYSGLDLLIIDEIGIQHGSDTEKLLLSEIIDNRYQKILPTVLISNLDAQGIKDCIGDRSFDRLREDGGKLVAFDWESERASA